MITVGIVKTPIGNLKSAWNALYQTGYQPIWADENLDYDAFTHLVVPGVGHFQAVMENLEKRNIADRIRAFAATKRPVLGICVGMQLLASIGTEGQPTRGLGLVPGKVIRLPEGPNTRLPHVGWNTLKLTRPHPVFEGVKPDRDFYFVHSYAFNTDSSADCLGRTEYGVDFTSVVARENVIGFQFHPEKSQINGLRLLENFCAWDGRC